MHDRTRSTSAVTVRPAVLLALAAFVIYLALEEIFASTGVWPLPAWSRYLYLVVGVIGASWLGRRTSFTMAMTILVASLAVLVVVLLTGFMN